MDIASGSVLPVAQWTWNVHIFSRGTQTGRASAKCLFVRFIICTVNQISLKLSYERKEMDREYGTQGVHGLSIEVFGSEP